MILLTEDEIVAYAARDKTYCQLSVDVGLWVAKAQAEKDEQENVNAITDYAEGKISVEKLGERLGVNFYDLYAAFNKYTEIEK